MKARKLERRRPDAARLPGASPPRPAPRRPDAAPNPAPARPAVLSLPGRPPPPRALPRPQEAPRAAPARLPDRSPAPAPPPRPEAPRALPGQVPAVTAPRPAVLKLPAAPSRPGPAPARLPGPTPEAPGRPPALMPGGTPRRGRAAAGGGRPDELRGLRSVLGDLAKALRGDSPPPAAQDRADAPARESRPYAGPAVAVRTALETRVEVARSRSAPFGGFAATLAALGGRR